MLELDEIESAGALATRVRRAVRDKRVELVRDAETGATAALVPWELLREWAEVGDPRIEPLRKDLEQLASRQQVAGAPAQDPARGGDAPPGADAENAASIALLQTWLQQDATDDPEEIQRAEEELEEFKQGINAERQRAGARRIYP